ncbi:Bug family tripartite tricarboxylate transporter substrate binding protein [Limnohabitans sp.]|uniref:Bug family tripartite tricarboxylate transporter substrate binding protein n=1 Tax=Limnohabitans sp. TaxID=1907725 RepID=UPI0038B8C0AB
MMRKTRQFLGSIAAFCVAVFTPTHGVSAEQDAWPNRPVRVVIPYAPGNTGDITFRLIQNQLEAKFGVRFLIDNKSGASGNIGAEEVVRAAADGYTFLLGSTNNYVTNASLIKSMRFDPMKDLVPITMISNAPSVVVVNANLAVNTLAELTALAKKESGKLAFASPGNGTPPHLAAELYKQLAGVDLIHVPYRGSAPAVQGLLGGDTQIYMTALSSVAGNISAGKLKAIAVAGPHRLSVLPNVPTTAQQGVPEMITGNWWGLSAPLGTDSKIIQKLAEAIQTVLNDPAVKQKYFELGVTPVGSSPSEFAAQIAHEASIWKKVIARSGIQPE